LITKDLKATPYEKMHNKQPNMMDNLHTFGELAIVHDGKTKIKAKLKDKGLVAMFVGYPDNHAGEVCQFFNITTKIISNSRTAICLHKTYAVYFTISKDLISHISADDSEVEIEAHEVTLTPDQPDETFINLVEDLPEEEDEED
jgi:hypothetical protein